MARDRSLVRASDIGAWTYCHRAWWLAQVRGVEHRNPQALQLGESAHRAHGQQVVRSHRLMQVGGALLAIAALLALAVIASWLL